MTDNQKRTLVEFLKKKTKIYNLDQFSYKNAQTKWMELSDILNSMPGVFRDWKGWRKTWQDTKSRTKQKASQSKKYVCGTGGGPYLSETELTQDDQNILEIIKPVSVDGHRGAQESDTSFLFDLVDDNIVVFEQADTVVSKEDNPRETLTETSSNNAKKSKLSYTAKAAENLRVDLAAKTQLKENYYEKKLQFLERIAVAQERSAEARERSATAMESISAKIRIADALEVISKNIT